MWEKIKSDLDSKISKISVRRKTNFKGDDRKSIEEVTRKNKSRDLRLHKLGRRGPKHSQSPAKKFLKRSQSPPPRHLPSQRPVSSKLKQKDLKWLSNS